MSDRERADGTLASRLRRGGVARVVTLHLDDLERAGLEGQPLG